MKVEENLVETEKMVGMARKVAVVEMAEEVYIV